MAVLALVSQLALGAVVLPDTPAAGVLAVLDAVQVQCDGARAPGQDPASRPAHHAADPALCPLSAALALPGFFAAPDPVLPEPQSAVVLAEPARPAGRGPPPPTARVGAPRAPPLTA